MDPTIIAALITSFVALIVSLVSAINSRKALSAQKELLLIPMQKKLFEINIRQLKKIQKTLKEEDQKKVEGIAPAKNSAEKQDNIATIMAHSVHSQTKVLPELMDEAYLITKREYLKDLKKTIEDVNEYKGLLQAKHVYGETINDEKLSEYKDTLNPIDSVLTVRKEFDKILDQEINRFNEQIQGLVVNT